MVSDSAKLSQDSLAQQFAASSGPEADTLLNIARAIAISAEFSEDIGATFIGLAVLTSGVLFVLSKAVYRPLGWLGVASGTLTLFNWLYLVSDSAFVMGMVSVIGSLIFLLLTGVWLLL